MIKNLLTNWKTSSAGLLMILGAVVHLAFAIKHGTADEGTWIATLTAIVGGVGLIAAGDAAQAQKQQDQVVQNVKRAIQTGDTSILEKPNGTATPVPITTK